MCNTAGNTKLSKAYPMSNDIPFKREFDYEYGRVDKLSPLIRRVIAPNPGPFTFTGTGTYIVGQGGGLCVIDPGPIIDSHLEAILAAVQPGEHISHILITHTHLDHSPLAMALKDATGATIYAEGIHGGEKPDESDVVEEGADRAFAYDVKLNDGDTVKGDSWTMECVHTPGHTSNHMAFALKEEKVLFSGDHVMGWSTSVISPPDGDMDAYMESLKKLTERDDEIYWPTHGPAIENPKPFVRAFMFHRRTRDRQIMKSIEEGRTDIAAMVQHMYRDVDERLHPAAARSVLAHIIALEKRGEISCDTEEPGLKSTYGLTTGAK